MPNLMEPYAQQSKVNGYGYITVDTSVQKPLKKSVGLVRAKSREKDKSAGLPNPAVDFQVLTQSVSRLGEIGIGCAVACSSVPPPPALVT